MSFGSVGSFEGARGEDDHFPYRELCQTVSEKLCCHARACQAGCGRLILADWRRAARPRGSGGRPEAVPQAAFTEPRCCENKHSCGGALNISVQRGIKGELYR